MASPTQWTWVWVNSESWWWTGRPSMLQFMGSSNWTELIAICVNVMWYLTVVLIAICVNVMWYLTVVLIHISLVTDDVEHCFMCLFGHLCIFFGEMSILIFCPCISWIAFLLLSYVLCILNTRSLSDVWFASIFFPFCGLSFHFLITILSCIKLLNFDQAQFVFVSYTFGDIFKNPLWNPRSWRFTPLFSSKSFIIFALTFRSFNYFELNFGYCEFRGTASLFCVWLSNCSNTTCWRKYYFLVEWSWHLYCQSVWP